jgi:hypothetical protein
LLVRFKFCSATIEPRFVLTDKTIVQSPYPRRRYPVPLRTLGIRRPGKRNRRAKISASTDFSSNYLFLLMIFSSAAAEAEYI